MSTFIHSFIPKAAFLAGVLLLVATSCDNQTAVDSLREPENEQAGIIKEERLYSEEGLALKTIPFSEITLSEHMHELLEERGIASDQVLYTGSSDSGKEKVVKKALEGSNAESEVGLMYMIDPCFEPLYGDDIDCNAAFPSPSPGQPAPQPPMSPSILLIFRSFAEHAYVGSQVQMGSWSWASQNLDYVGVSGQSFRDYQLIATRGYGKANINAAGVVYNTSKPGYPYSAEMYWRQTGEHYFEHNGIPLVLFSSASMDF